MEYTQQKQKNASLIDTNGYFMIIFTQQILRIDTSCSVEADVCVY